MGETLGNMRNASNYYELRERRDAESITPEAYPSSQKNVENNDSIDPIL